MKKVFLFLFLLSYSVIFCQEKDDFEGFKKGDFYISGQLSYSSSESNNNDFSDFRFQPIVGFFIDKSNSLELGLIIGSNESGQSEISSLGATASLVHFFNVEDKFSFTLGGGLAYISSSFENSFQGDYKSNIFQIAVFPGVNYFLTNKIALNANIGVLSYAREKSDLPGAEANNNFNINFNLSNVNFGFIYRF